MKISPLVAKFFENAANRFTVGSTLPIKASKQATPIFATTRWCISNGFLKKSFVFLQQKQRNAFVSSLLSYEAEVGHHAFISILPGGETNNFQVDVSVASSEDGGMITELDKEYARNADIIHVEIMRS